jgi:hypothetical protein
LKKTQFGAEAGRRARLREILCKTLDYLVTRGAAGPEDTAFAGRPDEDLTERVIAILLREILSLELKVEYARVTLTEADKFLEQIQAQAEEKLEKAA